MALPPKGRERLFVFRAANFQVMIRAILYLVISIFLITFIRLVIGISCESMREMMSAPGSSRTPFDLVRLFLRSSAN